MSFEILPYDVPTILTRADLEQQEIEEGGSWQPCYSDSIFKIREIAHPTIQGRVLYEVTRLLAVKEQYPLGKRVFVSFDEVIALKIDKATGMSERPELRGWVFETMLRGDCSGYVVKRIR